MTTSTIKAKCVFAAQYGVKLVWCKQAIICWKEWTTGPMRTCVWFCRTAPRPSASLCMIFTRKRSQIIFTSSPISYLHNILTTHLDFLLYLEERHRPPDLLVVVRIDPPVGQANKRLGQSLAEAVFVVLHSVVHYPQRVVGVGFFAHGGVLILQTYKWICTV